uniref:Uncharacterized protein n=1 Tax=Populus trichocarpa TaxID=3694 RepID=B9H951_POPTR
MQSTHNKIMCQMRHHQVLFRTRTLWDEKAKFPKTLPEKPGNNTIMNNPIFVLQDHPHSHKSNGSRNKSV